MSNCKEKQGPKKKGRSWWMKRNKEESPKLKKESPKILYEPVQQHYLQNLQQINEVLENTVDYVERIAKNDIQGPQFRQRWNSLSPVIQYQNAKRVVEKSESDEILWTPCELKVNPKQIKRTTSAPEKLVNYSTLEDTDSTEVPMIINVDKLNDNETPPCFSPPKPEMEKEILELRYESEIHEEINTWLDFSFYDNIEADIEGSTCILQEFDIPVLNIDDVLNWEN